VIQALKASRLEYDLFGKIKNQITHRETKSDEPMGKPLKMQVQKAISLSLKNILTKITSRLKRMDGEVTGHWKVNLKSSKGLLIKEKTSGDSIL
jgi:hypothetical protein